VLLYIQVKTKVRGMIPAKNHQKAGVPIPSPD